MIDETIASLAKTLDFLRGLVADVPEDMMTAQPTGATNHPAWVIGHLVYRFQLIGGEMGLAPWLAPRWEQQFGTGSVPSRIRSEYPSKSDLLEALADGQRRVGERMEALGEVGLTVPLPDVRYRHIFPSLGHTVLHVLTSHAAVHVGQISVWRRVIGLGPSKEIFH